MNYVYVNISKNSRIDFFYFCTIKQRYSYLNNYKNLKITFQISELYYLLINITPVFPGSGSSN